MAETGSDFLAEIARKVADSDAQAKVDIANILAGRPYHRRTAPKAGSAADSTEAPAKKPRARRQPKAKRPSQS